MKTESPNENLKWLMVNVVKASHELQLEEHGGSAGMRDEEMLLSALARPENYYSYGERNLFVLATAYAGGIIRNHPFVDGNKRTGFLAAYIFLFINGYKLTASEAEAVKMTIGLAASEIDEAEFAKWLEHNCMLKSDEEE